MKLQTNAKGQVTIVLPTVLKTNRQKYTVNQMLERYGMNSTIEYLQTFSKKSEENRTNRSKQRLKEYLNHSQKHDSLAEKTTGSVLKLFSKMLQNLRIDHKPTKIGNDWIGVEIECLIPLENDLHDFKEQYSETRECSDCEGHGVVPGEDDEEETCYNCDGSGRVADEDSSVEIGYYEQLSKIFQHRKIKFTSIKHDGSLNDKDGYFNVEVTVLTRLSSPDSLQKACAVLNELGAIVDKSCGLHVHLDARQEWDEYQRGGNQVRVNRIGNNFEKALDVMLQCVPEFRRTNRAYCAPVVSDIHGNRYSAVNMTALSKFGTIEVRLHSPSTDFEKILAWSKFLMAIKNAEKIKTSNDLNTLCEYIKIEESVMEYLSKRIALFSGEKSKQTKSVEDTDLVA